jgi:hypothetical protein
VKERFPWRPRNVAVLDVYVQVSDFEQIGRGPESPLFSQGFDAGHQFIQREGFAR